MKQQKIRSIAAVVFVVGLTLCVVGLTLCAPGQTFSHGSDAKPPKKASPVARRKLTPEQRFVRDAVSMAVALPQADPQDRLRVLSSAANVISPIDSTMSKNLWREGARIESELIQLGRAPAVSVMSGGQVDCAAAQSFVENVPEDSVAVAEQSLIGAVTSCQKQTLDPVGRKLDAALRKRVVAPRALMAAMEAEGSKSPWSQAHFEAMFNSLPDPQKSGAEAENFAAMYARMSGEVEKGIAKKAGLKLLDWLAPLNDADADGDSGLRALGLQITAGAMKQVLGEQGFEDALSSDAVAASAVRNSASGTGSSGTGKIETPPASSETQGVSVLGAITNNGADQSDRLRDLPARERAQEAAAHGFAAGTSGDKQQAGKYFDMAFAAVDEVWDARSAEQNTAAVVEEVSEAAAQVDSVNAMTRAGRLRDPSAQAIAILAVARVVAGAGLAR